MPPRLLALESVGLLSRGCRLGGWRGLASGGGPQSSSSDPYAVLGIPRGSTVAEARSAFIRLSKEVHPDTSDAPDAKERFLEVSTAYDAIKAGRTLAWRNPSASSAPRRPPAPTGPRAAPGPGAYGRPVFDSRLQKMVWPQEKSEVELADERRRQALEDRARMDAELKRHYAKITQRGRAYRKQKIRLWKPFVYGMICFGLANLLAFNYLVGYLL